MDAAPHKAPGLPVTEQIAEPGGTPPTSTTNYYSLLAEGEDTADDSEECGDDLGEENWTP